MNDPQRANAELHPRGPITSDEQLIGRVRGEYLEMPGLRLTRRQAQRLWGLDDDTSDRILTVLVERKFLTRAPDGSFMRLTDGTLSGPFRMAKADLPIDTSVFVPERRAARRS
jgi:hypothetical protein